MDRNELLKANEALHRRRKAEGVGNGPQSISRPASRLVETEGQTVVDYFEALAGGNGQNPAHVIDGSRAMWDSFNSDRHPKLQEAVRIIKKWYNQRLDVGGALIIAGGYGCGKSHLAKAVADLYGWQAVFYEETKLFKAIQQGYGGHGDSEHTIFMKARRAPLLIYDDLGSYETDNDAWIQNIYRQLFDRRFEEGKGFLITTNLALKGTPSEFEERVGGRNFTRILGAVEHPEYYVNLFGVPDYRLRHFV